jgi:hypothetical protein
MAEETLATRRTAASEAEAVGLAHEMARAYGEMVRFLRRQMQMSPEEAFAHLSDPPEDQRERLLAAPPDQVFWTELSQLWEKDPEAGQAVWQGIKAQARAELDSGHRAAKALDYGGRPWERARFLAVRQAFRDEWRPRGGIEDALLDTLAQSYTSQLFWTEQLHVQSSLEYKPEETETRQHGHWRGPRLKDAEAMEQSAAMVERFNRLFVRTLRTLRDLRRYAPAIHIEHVGQVNMAQGPQLNVSESEPRDSTTGRDSVLQSRSRREVKPARASD